MEKKKVLLFVQHEQQKVALQYVAEAKLYVDLRIGLEARTISSFSSVLLLVQFDIPSQCLLKPSHVSLSYYRAVRAYTHL